MSLLSYSKVIDPFLREVRNIVPRFANMKKSSKVLDVCCGTGDQVFFYHKVGLLASGIDKSPEMIEVARKRKKKESITNVSFQLAEVQDIPFENGTFDFVSVSLGLHEMKEKERIKAISEMKRVVKGEGSLILVDFTVPLPKSFLSFLIGAIEYLAGRENYEAFTDYLSNGGLPELLRRNNLQEEKRDYLMSKLLTIIEARERI